MRRAVLIAVLFAAGPSRADDRSPHTPVVIDRSQQRTVEHKPLQGGVAKVTPLVDAPDVALLHIEMPPDLHLDLAATDNRHELWFITDGDAITTRYYDRFRQTISPDWQDLDAGDLMDVPAGSFRRLDAGDHGLSAVVLYVPGDIAAAMKLDALPGTPVTEPGNGERKPFRVRYKRSLRTHKARGVEVKVVALGARRKLTAPTDATEIVYVLGGTGTAIVDAQAFALDNDAVVHVPRGATRTIVADKAFRVLQVVVRAN